jgi:hypothetical protein
MRGVAGTARFGRVREEVPLDAEADEASAQNRPTWRERLFLEPVRPGHLAYFCRALAAYLDLGFDLHKALATVEPTFRESPFGPAIGRIRLALRCGDTLAVAMARERWVFDGQLPSMIRNAEAEGRVAETLRVFAHDLKQHDRISRTYSIWVSSFGLLLIVLCIVVAPCIVWRLPMIWIVNEAVAVPANSARLVHLVIIFRDFVPMGRGWVLCTRFESHLPLLLLCMAVLAGLPYAARWITPVVDRCERALFEDDEPLRGADLLADFERGGAAGEMTEEEFGRVRERIAAL